MLYQRVTGDFYTTNSEGKFTLPRGYLGVVHVRRTWYNTTEYDMAPVGGNEREVKRNGYEKYGGGRDRRKSIPDQRL